ncbi:glycosyltransferase [Pantoea septica]|uniref:glycosyltransferase n=1 Tax=Pantoea septica TaxID=472695 RepID=UPI00289C712D|nr:glycosyltransferase [Pantoea septica]
MNDNKRILFSVVTILTDKFVHFENTFYSLVRQSYPHWELIIISSEENKQALSEFKSKHFSGHHQNINILYIDSCKSYATAMNVGFRIANGDYIIFIEQFDRINEDYFTYVAENYSEDNPELFYSQVMINYEFTFLKRPLLAGIKNHPSNDEFISLNNVLNRPTISSLSFLFPKNIKNKIGYLKETRCDFPVWDYLIRASDKFVFHKMETSLYQLTIKSNYINPKIFQWNKNKITNSKYLFLHDSFANNQQYSLDYNARQNQHIKAVFDDDYARSKIISKIRYNKIFYSVIIKTFKFVKYIFTQMR